MLLDEIFDKFNSECKMEVATIGLPVQSVETIPLSSIKLTYNLYGGIPMGRITMVVGGESSGKTTLNLDIIKNFQEYAEKKFYEETKELTEKIDQGKATKEDKERLTYLNKRGPLVAVYVNQENKFDSIWAKKMGVNLDKLGFIEQQNQSGEVLLNQIIKVAQAENVGLIIVDSITNIEPSSTFNKSLGESAIQGGNSALIDNFLAKVHPHIARRGQEKALIIVNQIRADFKNPNNMYIPCGYALRFHSSLILNCTSATPIDEDCNELAWGADSIVGRQMWVRLIKSDIFPENRRNTMYYLNQITGIDPYYELLDLCVIYELILKGGNWYTFMDPTLGIAAVDPDGNPVKFNGAQKAREYLKDNPDLFAYYKNIILSKCKEDLFNTISKITINEEEGLQKIIEAELMHDRLDGDPNA